MYTVLIIHTVRHSMCVWSQKRTRQARFREQGKGKKGMKRLLDRGSMKQPMIPQCCAPAPSPLLSLCSNTHCLHPFTQFPQAQRSPASFFGSTNQGEAIRHPLLLPPSSFLPSPASSTDRPPPLYTTHLHHYTKHHTPTPCLSYPVSFVWGDLPCQSWRIPTWSWWTSRVL